MQYVLFLRTNGPTELITPTITLEFKQMIHDISSSGVTLYHKCTTFI